MGRRRRSKKPTNGASSPKLNKQQAEEEKNQLSRSRLPNPATAPWLMFCHHKHQKTQALYSAPEAKSYTRSVRELRRNCEFKYWPSPQGWIFMRNQYSDDSFLLNPVSLARVALPPLKLDPNVYLIKFVLSASPTEGNCSILFLTSGGDKYYDLLFYHPNNRNSWVADLDIVDHGYNNIDNRIEDITACNGKFFGLTLQGMLVMIDPIDPSCVEVRSLILTGPTMPPGYTYMMYKSYLLESCGEVFLIKRTYVALPNVVQSILVYKMDLDNKVWNEMVDSFCGGDQVFFLGNACSGSCSASEKMMKGNCIYFYENHDPNLYIYDLDDRSISIELPCPNLQSPWSTPIWLMPPR